MTDLSDSPLAQAGAGRTLRNKVRFVTAAALFDGHDASINIMRRILQASGAEVVHLGHNRSVDEVVTAALHEDVHGIAVSSYQGGHLEYFKYMVDLLRQRGGEGIRVFGGGGGVIVAEEIRELHAHGVTRIYSPADGQRLGLEGMIWDMLARCDRDLAAASPTSLSALDEASSKAARWRALAGLITRIEAGAADPVLLRELSTRAAAARTPVLGVTGTGGAGKSSLTDELIRRFRLDYGDTLDIAVISIDPSRRKSGGALLGDRIRMNAIHPWNDGPRVFMRSLATREAGSEIARCLPEVIAACRCAGFALVVVETSGIGQGDAAIVGHVDHALYVMTPDYGAASQLEKIDMLDFADTVAINKFDRKGAQDAWRDVCKQVQRNRAAFDRSPAAMPVFGNMASRFNDDGVSALYGEIRRALSAHGLPAPDPARLALPPVRTSSNLNAVVPPGRSRYLAEIADTVRDYKRWAHDQAQAAAEWQALQMARAALEPTAGPVLEALDGALVDAAAALAPQARRLLEAWPRVADRYRGEVHEVQVRDRPVRTRLATRSLSGTPIPKVALPRLTGAGDLLRWLLLENLPGEFPFTAGVFHFKREGEDPTRMFAGEGDPARTNRRFKYLSQGNPATRLSTAFDSVTLYGANPARRPDIYGKVGNSGVSVATLDDMKQLFEGFDLCAPGTSVSMTINGPAPTLLAMYLNAAFDQQVDLFVQREGREPDASEREAVLAHTLRSVRGTVQADILKEDQGQNTCIFSTEFSLKVMGDVQQYFVDHEVRNFYSVSISGYHIAEAGANPISQLAFTLANGFTFVEAYLARGMHIDDFAPNLSFFFSNGIDPEYTVLGRVARRIWATTIRNRYGGNERSQKLKYHIQTSGRSLHAQEIAFNDIRTTLQALCAIYDNCNSLHTNAYDEAITTPTEESVRRALAIQLIINREWGLAKNENPLQGSFIVEELTDLVEEAVLREFDALSERGGVLGAMELGYQRSRIQEESMHYEMLKHSGELPIIGVNTFLNPQGDGMPERIELARSTEGEKESQIERLARFEQRHAQAAPQALRALQQAVLENRNVFAELMQAVRHCSLGQITEALFAVGGQYRRNM